MCLLSQERQAIQSLLQETKNNTWAGHSVFFYKTSGNPSEEMMDLLQLALQIHSQKRTDSGKVYSVHEPHVTCLSKGKPQKKFEFGNKASIVTTAKGNWIVGALGLKGGPYDGHTLEEALSQSAACQAACLIKLP